MVGDKSPGIEITRILLPASAVEIRPGPATLSARQHSGTSALGNAWRITRRRRLCLMGAFIRQLLPGCWDAESESPVGTPAGSPAKAAPPTSVPRPPILSAHSVRPMDAAQGIVSECHHPPSSSPTVYTKLGMLVQCPARPHTPTSMVGGMLWFRWVMYSLLPAGHGFASKDVRRADRADLPQRSRLARHSVRHTASSGGRHPGSDRS